MVIPFRNKKKKKIGVSAGRCVSAGIQKRGTRGLFYYVCNRVVGYIYFEAESRGVTFERLEY